MAERIVDILREPTLSHQMGEAGRRIAERHSIDRSVTLHEGVYQALVSNRFREAQRKLPFQPLLGTS
jgi:hypothetical protein